MTVARDYPGAVVTSRVVCLPAYPTGVRNITRDINPLTRVCPQHTSTLFTKVGCLRNVHFYTRFRANICTQNSAYPETVELFPPLSRLVPYRYILVIPSHVRLNRSGLTALVESWEHSNVTFGTKDLNNFLTFRVFINMSINGLFN